MLTCDRIGFGNLACSVSPDGRRIVTVADSGMMLKIWDSETGEELAALKGHESPITACAYSPDGRRILSASKDSTLKLWDAETGEELKTLRRHRDAVNACAFSPDDRRIVSADDGGVLKTWDVRSGRKVCTRRVHREWASGCAYSADGRVIIISSGFFGYPGEIKVLKAETLEEVAAFFSGGAVYCLATGGAHWRIVAGCERGALSLLQVEGVEFGPPIATFVYLSGEKVSREYSQPTFVCEWCGRRLEAPPIILDIIKSIKRSANLSFCQSPCVYLLPEAWDEPRLLSECPSCRQPLKFNPFIVDNRDTH